MLKGWPLRVIFFTPEAMRRPLSGFSGRQRTLPLGQAMALPLALLLLVPLAPAKAIPFSLPSLRVAGPLALRPRAPPPPPPALGLQWVLHGPPRTLLTVDAGQGERWLRALHPRAQAPLLLWRAAGRAREGAAPPWLERQSSCLIAAGTLARVNSFLVLDMAGGEEMVGFRDRLQLNSDGVIGISFVEESLPHSEALPQARRDELNSFLWVLHQSYRWLLMHETSQERNGGWDPFSDPTYFSPNHMPSCAGVACLFRNVVVSAQVAGRIAMLTYCSSPPEKLSHGLVEIGIQGKCQGFEARFLQAAGDELLVHWDVPSKFSTNTMTYQSKRLENDQGLNSTAKPKEKSDLNETLNSFDFINEILGENQVEFVPMYYHSAGSVPPAIDLASASMQKASVWVLLSKGPARPRPRLLPPHLALLLGGVAAFDALTGVVASGFSAFSQRRRGTVRRMVQSLRLVTALLASVTLLAIFQGHLFTQINHPYIVKRDTLEELAQSNLMVLSLPIAHKALIEEPVSNTQWTPRFITYDQLPLLYQETQEFALIGTEGDLGQLQALETAWEMCYPLKNAFHTSTKFFLLKRNWPWMNEMNELIGKLLATGLLHHWTDTFGAMKQFHCEHAGQSLAPLRDAGDREILEMFSFAQALPYMFLLAGGWVLAVIIFVAECWRKGRLEWEKIRMLGQRCWSCFVRLYVHLSKMPGKVWEILPSFCETFDPSDSPFGSVSTLQDMEHQLSEPESKTDAESAAAFPTPKRKEDDG